MNRRPNLARDESLYCQKCGEDNILHYDLTKPETEPQKPQCPATDHIGRQGIEKESRQVLADHWERLGWGIDY